jgi:hypothetical protein
MLDPTPVSYFAESRSHCTKPRGDLLHQNIVPEWVETSRKKHISWHTQETVPMWQSMFHQYLQGSAQQEWTAALCPNASTDKHTIKISLTYAGSRYQQQLSTHVRRYIETWRLMSKRHVRIWRYFYAYTKIYRNVKSYVKMPLDANAKPSHRAVTFKSYYIWFVRAISSVLLLTCTGRHLLVSISEGRPPSA